MELLRIWFSGGIGQPLSLLLKQSPLVTELSLYDIVHTPGVAADLSHIDTPAKVEGHNGAENLEKALKGEIDAYIETCRFVSQISQLIHNISFSLAL